MSLSSWLRDYLYISLGGNRKGQLRTYINLFLTMLLGGLWHGAAFKFILWGGLHGLGLAVHKYLRSIKFPWLEKESWWTKLVGVVLTFHFVCFCWIFFRATSMETAGQMIWQIAAHFSPQVFGDFIAGYSTVLWLMALGYVLHFLPHSLELKAEQFVTAMPMAGKVALTVTVIVLVIETKSAGIQPFIYFQF